MSSDLSRLFAQACNTVCSFAPVYPSMMMSNLDDCMPGCYGTYKDGIWSKLGTLPDFQVSQYIVSDPGTYLGTSTWSSEKMTTVAVYLKGTAWVVGEDGAGDAQGGMQFSDATDTLFHVAVGDTYEYEMDASVLDQITAQVQNRKDGDDLRFVTTLVATNAYLAFGGRTKHAQCVISGDAQALSDAVAGKVSAAVTIAQTNVSDISKNISPGNQMIPVGMYLYQIGKHGKVMNNTPS
jgi:hypothetical protein